MPRTPASAPVAAPAPVRARARGAPRHPTQPGGAEPASGQRAVQSVEVGGRLLLALAAERAPMSLKDVSAAAGLPPARAHPYLVSWGRLGLVAQDGASGRYALGPAALRLGLSALHQCEALQAAVPVAEELAADTGQAVFIAVWGNLGPTVVRLIEARQPLHLALRVGTVMSVQGSATGRAFLGAWPLPRLEALLAGPLGQAQGPLDTPSLRRDAAQAAADLAAHGLTRAAGRPLPGVNAFSAPVRQHDGEVALVLTALGHQDHFAVDWNSVLADRVRAAAAAVSSRLGA